MGLGASKSEPMTQFHVLRSTKTNTSKLVTKAFREKEDMISTSCNLEFESRPWPNF